MKFEFIEGMLPLEWLTIYSDKSEPHLGSFISPIDEKDLVDKLNKAEFEEIELEPGLSYRAFKTIDVGLGYKNSLTKQEVLELLSKNSIPNDTKLYLRMFIGNIDSYILLKDIDLDILITDELYYYWYDRIPSSVWLSFNKPCRYNKLSGRTDLDNKVLPLSSLKKTNRIYKIDVRKTHLNEADELPF
jgi:hypothetical protein